MGIVAEEADESHGWLEFIEANAKTDLFDTLTRFVDLRERRS